MEIALIDVGNVLLDVDFHKFCSKAAQIMGIGEDRIFPHFCSGPLKEELDKGLRSPASFLEQAASACNAGMNYHELKECWSDIFTLSNEAISAVTHLRPHFKLWIMSDTDPLHFNYFQNRFPLMRSFDQYILSYATGYLKSEEEAFRAFAQDPHNSYTLIDDKEINCATARRCGLASVHFQNWSQALDELL